ncbi:MAG: carboxypeptidase-like regulatory domain-containing protein [Gemmatimonadota bacterium]|nr:carboxypeptidase-like regulatory domain-containing protein [Gemmatimonadota bacterium]
MRYPLHRRNLRSGITALSLLGAMIHPRNMRAQAETVRGRVTDDSSRAVPAATVIITRGPDRLVQQTVTDTGGHYASTFEPGTGDYLVFVSALGYASARRRVQRAASERELVADFILKRDLSVLATVNVKASKPARATNDVSPYQQEPGSSEKWNDGVAASITPSLAGDLNAIAGTMSNVTMTGNGPSILGSGSESNLNTLNGMGMSAGSIPRAVRTDTRVTGATFDPTRGGFSGSNTDVQLGPGSRMNQNRRAFLTFSPAMLQLTDVTGRETGAQSSLMRGSIGGDGELIRNALTYNMGIDIAHSDRDPATLADASAGILLRSGIAPDSVARLLAVAPSLGLSATGRALPRAQPHDAFSWLGRLDDTRDTMATRALTTYATYSRDGGLGYGPVYATSTASQQTQSAFGAQLTLGNYIGAQRLVLTETRLGASTTRAHATPYLQLPAANVLVLSSLANGTSAAEQVFLGGGRLNTDDSRWTLEGSNQTIWNLNGRRNHFKAMLWARMDGLRQNGVANQFGTFGFNSIADLAAGIPSSFSRTITQPQRSGTVWNAATAIAHQWSPSRQFSVLYGARLEADGFGSTPARNPALESALGVHTDVAPMRFNLSPRIGFSYTYSRDKDNGNGEAVNNVGAFYRSTVGVFRGGIGEFRDLLRPDMLSSASAATGLPSGTAAISCVGAVTPIPDWTSFAVSPANIPSRCLDGSGLLTESAPPVSLISPSYDVPRSWRTSLDWNSNFGAWLVRIATLGSYDLSQPGTVDANFSGVKQFALSGDGNRPVFVSAAAIDAASGSVSPTQSRISPAFGRVAMRTSDLRGYGGQITGTVSPDIFKFRNDHAFYASLSYTLQESRREYRGFDGAAFGDPRITEWAASNNDARNIIVLTGGYSAALTGTLTLFARMQSGLPFTPLVQGDVNGDGLSGDRAFIPNPASTTDTAVASQIRSLLSNGSGTARNCLSHNLGRVVPRNGCRGPWSTTLNMQWQPPLPRSWMRRVTASVYFENVLGGVDEMLHGSNLRGWGAQPVVDPVLLVPHAFDPSAKQFAYTVNPRFADTRPANSLTRNPFRVTIDFSFDLSTDYDLQQLRRAVEPVRSGKRWTRRSADSLTSFYLRRTSDIYQLLIENSDSLFLSRGQTEALQHSDSVYSTRVKAIYSQLGEYLASLNGSDPGKAALDSAKQVQKAYWKIFWEQPEIADSAITPSQRALMPELVGLLAVPQKNREFSQWSFGHPVRGRTGQPQASQPRGTTQEIKRE